MPGATRPAQSSGADSVLVRAILEIDRAGQDAGAMRASGKAGASSGSASSLNALTRAMLDQRTASPARPQGRAPQAVPPADTALTVQYNPQSIRYRARISEGGPQKKDDITTVTRESTVEMSFTLVFYDQSPEDQAVKERMEQIMDMIHDSPTKRIRFSWADIRIEGALTSFSGAYDMFDPSGKPVSGHMDLTIETKMSAQQTQEILDELEEEHVDSPVPGGV